MSPSIGTMYSASLLVSLVLDARAGASFSEELGHQPHFVTAPHTAMKWQQERIQMDSYKA